MIKPSKLKLSVVFIKEGKRYIAYSPALDLSTTGKSEKEAKMHFEEIVDVFFEELENMGTTEGALKELGWHKKTKQQWQPPQIVSQQSIAVRMPVAV